MAGFRRCGPQRLKSVFFLNANRAGGPRYEPLRKLAYGELRAPFISIEELPVSAKRCVENCLFGYCHFVRGSAGC